MMLGNKKILKVFYLLAVTLLLLLWLEQRSVNAYWVQTYHQNSPLSALDNNKIWRVGGDIANFLSSKLVVAQNKMMDLNEETVTDFNNNFQTVIDGLLASGSEAFQLTHELVIDMPAMYYVRRLYLFPHKPFIRIAKLDENNANLFTQDNILVVSKIPKLIQPDNTDTRFLVEKGQKVFFVGDSLMQGVAPHAMRVLLKQHGIESINLSKQSTGLSYPKFYNWPDVARETMIKNPDIKLMVVFMGPNDPWDFPVAKSKRFFRFNTPEWEGVYRTRIQQLINAATEHGAKVLWIGAPNVKNDKLNAGIIHLNALYYSQVSIAQQRYVPSNDILGMTDDRFVKFIQIPDRGNVTLRTDDGTHFTTIGQKRIADKIMSLLRFSDSTGQVNK